MFYPTVSSFFEAEGDFTENKDVEEILELLEPDPWGHA
jgi:hypothetical protein